MATQTLLSAEQFDTLPEDELHRYELFDGELIEVSAPRSAITALSDVCSCP